VHSWINIISARTFRKSFGLAPVQIRKSEIEARHGQEDENLPNLFSNAYSFRLLHWFPSRNSPTLSLPKTNDNGIALRNGELPCAVEGQVGHQKMLFT
jgi:hypothetical protein